MPNQEKPQTSTLLGLAIVMLPLIAATTVGVFYLQSFGVHLLASLLFAPGL